MAQSENMVDQVTTRGLLTVTSKAANTMVEKLATKLAGPELQPAKADDTSGEAGLVLLETKLRAAHDKLNWA